MQLPSSAWLSGERACAPNEDVLVAAGFAKLVWSAAERHGISPCELTRMVTLDRAALERPDALIPRATAHRLLRALMQHTRDPALGLQLARGCDLRAMGFWGYAVLASSTMRQGLQLHVQCQRLIHPTIELELSVTGDRAQIDFDASGIAADLLQVVMDFAIALACIQFGERAARGIPDAELWLPYPERPHHRKLRALTSGTIVFDAPHASVRFAAQELDRPLPGDPHLLELAKSQLHARLAQLDATQAVDIVMLVRQRLQSNLARDASLERIARDLRMSPRTLRRRLHGSGTSFQELLEEVRLARAVHYLRDTDHVIKSLAAELGYRDPSNFRRAFRRWTGAAPTDYRAKQRRCAATPSSILETG